MEKPTPRKTKTTQLCLVALAIIVASITSLYLLVKAQPEPKYQYHQESIESKLNMAVLELSLVENSEVYFDGALLRPQFRQLPQFIEALLANQLISEEQAEKILREQKYYLHPKGQNWTTVIE